MNFYTITEELFTLLTLTQSDLPASLPPSSPPAPPLAIFDDFRLATWCIVGSFLGMLLSIIVLPPRLQESKNFYAKMFTKYGGPFVVGATFVPGLVQYFQIRSPDYIVPLAAMVAICGISLLHATIPRIQRGWTQFFDKQAKERFGVDTGTEVANTSNGVFRLDKSDTTICPTPLPPKGANDASS